MELGDEKVRVVLEGVLYSRAGSVTGFTVFDYVKAYQSPLDVSVQPLRMAGNVMPH